jgi:penicillin-insensitive murein endopeptidase
VRPWWGHDYHFHVRLRCPGDSPENPRPKRRQAEGSPTPCCIPSRPGPEVPKPGKPLSSLPGACRAVLTAPNLHAVGSASGDHRQTH